MRNVFRICRRHSYRRDLADFECHMITDLITSNRFSLIYLRMDLIYRLFHFGGTSNVRKWKIHESIRAQPIFYSLAIKSLSVTIIVLLTLSTIFLYIKISVRGRVVNRVIVYGSSTVINYISCHTLPRGDSHYEVREYRILHLSEQRRKFSFLTLIN